MKGKGKIAGKGRAGARAPLALAAAVLAVALAFTVSYAYARYATEYEAAAPVAYFGATSRITYTDAWGTAQAFDGDLGTMMPKEEGGERTIEFTLYVENRSDVSINCTLTLSGDYELSFEEVELTEEEKGSYGTYTVPEDDPATLQMDETIEAGNDSLPVAFRVVVGDYKGSAGSAEVYSGTLDITVTYIQASEEETP